MKEWMELFRLAREGGQDEASLQFMERLIVEANVRREMGIGEEGAAPEEVRIARGAWAMAQEEYLRGAFVEEHHEVWEEEELLDLAADDGGLGEGNAGTGMGWVARFACEAWLLEWRAGRLRKREGPEGLSVEWAGEWVGLLGDAWVEVPGQPPTELRAIDARGRRKLFRLDE